MIDVARYTYRELSRILPPEFNAAAPVWIHASDYDALAAELAATQAMCQTLEARAGQRRTVIDQKQTRIAQLEAALREAIAQMESDAVFHEYDRGCRRISEIPDNDLPDALLHARAALAPKEQPS